ncbi:MAG: hypothetical protein ACFC03_00660 [Candidatus Malihini olakiniferum]
MHGMIDNRIQGYMNPYSILLPEVDKRFLLLKLVSESTFNEQVTFPPAKK